MNTNTTDNKRECINNATISIRLTSELKELILLYADKDNVTPSIFIRDILLKEISKRQI